MPAELSGGQQQRVGVARALAAEPNILLMDEPFGALDPIIRMKAQDDLIAIQKQFGVTVVLVTHDMEEAIRLGDRIAVMDEGRLLQYAPPADIIAHPATPFVDELIGTGERPFRLLSLAAVKDAVEPGDATGAPIAAEKTLRDAYAEMLWSGRAALPVEDAGRRIGRVTLTELNRRAARPQ
jgi:osmoprotectant transport system ATP-binding protein